MSALLVPALDVGKGAAVDGPAPPPTLHAIRLVYGVGTGRESLPIADAFAPTYHVAIPVFSLGGLDPDGVYEFDGAQLLAALTERATRRRWGVRLELELHQSAESAARAAVVVEPAPGQTLTLLTAPRGETLPGGGRRIVVATAIVTAAADVGTLDGAYRFGLDRGETRAVNVAFGRFEFEG